MTRRCSHCGHNGHNSRTCPDRGIRLFGVHLTDTMRKSASMGNLSSATMPGASAGGLGSNRDTSTPEHSESGGGADGYASDGLVQTSCNARERRKGVPWTEEEHRLFLLGLQKLGKGDWRGISRHYVTSRTPTQVASHAQKYFIRQSNLSKRKRRSSLFDISTEAHSMAVDEDFCPLQQLTLASGALVDAAAGYAPLRPPLAPTSPAEPQHSSSSCSMLRDPNATLLASLNSPFPPLRQPVNSPGTRPGCPTLVKPTATLQTAAIRIDEPCELTKLSLATSASSITEASPLTLKLEQPARHSAFHAKASNAASSSESLVSKPISVV